MDITKIGAKAPTGRKTENNRLIKTAWLMGVLIIMVFGLSGVIWAEPLAEPIESWNKTAGGNSSDWFSGVVVDSHNNIIVVGSTESFGAGSYDLWVLKYDDRGKMIWEKTAGGNSRDWGIGVATDSKDNIIVTGQLGSFGAGVEDVWVLKYDSHGNMIWNKTAGERGLDVGVGVAIDSNNNIIITGYTSSFGAGGEDILTIKYDSAGNMLWKKTAGGSSEDEGRDVATDSSDNIIVAGYTYSFGAGGSRDLWIIKYGPEGNELWNKIEGGISNDDVYGVVVDSNNNIVVTGYTSSFVAGSKDAWIIKYASDGNVIWNKTAGGVDYDEGSGVAVDSNDSIIVTGITESFSDKGKDVWTIKYDSNGQVIWNKTEDISDIDESYDVAVDSNNNIIVVGLMGSFFVGKEEAWIIKYSQTKDSNRTYYIIIGVTMLGLLLLFIIAKRRKRGLFFGVLLLGCVCITILTTHVSADSQEIVSIKDSFSGETYTITYQAYSNQGGPKPTFTVTRVNPGGGKAGMSSRIETVNRYLAIYIIWSEGKNREAVIQKIELTQY